MGVWGDSLAAGLSLSNNLGHASHLLLLLQTFFSPLYLRSRVSAIMSPLDFAGCNRLWDYISIMPYTIHG